MERLDFYSDTKHERTDEFNTEVFVSRRVYTDNGPSFQQERRYMREDDLERFGVVRCFRCGKLMTGGYSRYEDKKRSCHMCHRELLLEEIMQLMDEKSL